MVKRHRTTAEALLDAHVRFVMDQVTGAALQPWIEGELDALLAAAGKLKLNDVVTRRMIKDTARAYAVDLEPGGGIPELVGEMARGLYTHEVHRKTTLGDLLPEPWVVEFVDKALDLESLRHKLVLAAVDSPLYAEFASELLYRGIKGYLGENPLTRNIPGARSVMKLGRSAMTKASPQWEATVETGLKKYIGRSVHSTSRRSAEYFLQRMDRDALKEMILEVWAELRRSRTDVLQEDISALDVEELFVAGYEAWRHLRKTRFYGVMIDAGVDVFFDKYGDTALNRLLDEVGITRDIMVAEAMRYAPHVLKVLKRKQVLEPLIRRNLQRFYESEAVAQILGGR